MEEQKNYKRAKAVISKPQFIIDEEGNKTSVLLSIDDYQRLLEAWEEVADAEDFAKARASAKKFITMEEMRCRLKRKTRK